MLIYSCVEFIHRSYLMWEKTHFSTSVEIKNKSGRQLCCSVSGSIFSEFSQTPRYLCQLNETPSPTMLVRFT